MRDNEILHYRTEEIMSEAVELYNTYDAERPIADMDFVKKGNWIAIATLDGLYCKDLDPNKVNQAPVLIFD